MDDPPRSTAHDPAEPTVFPGSSDGATPDLDKAWHAILSGEDRGLPRLRRMWGAIPSSPRCKLCAAPFHGPGRLLTKVMMHGPSMSNPLMCNACFGQLRNMPGGTEIEISVLFADIRGSTGIAERTSAVEFRRLVQQFYLRAAKAIDQSDGIIDKFLGDGIMVLFIPLMTGPIHAQRAIEAGEALLRAVVDPELVAGGVRVGAGVHTGLAFVGTVGSDAKLDFTALGDTVNVAARLGSDAGAGELLVTATAWRAAGREGNAERREITVKGRAEPLEVVVLGASSGVAVA